MTEAESPKRAAGLIAVLDAIGPPAIAVSGGVDSLTLMAAAAERFGRDCEAIHAVSPAVPEAATARTREIAKNRNWRYREIDAGEFDDPSYLENPVNRCYFCKTNLYAAMADKTDLPLCSGANLDDLADVRPGLQAAAEHRVRHPFIDAGFDKASIRGMSRTLGLGRIAELPASPCLSSRMETGLRLSPELLAMIDEIETHIRNTVAPAMVRCRVRATGIEIELDADSLARVVNTPDETAIRRFVRLRWAETIAFKAYRMGSAVRTDAAG